MKLTRRHFVLGFGSCLTLAAGARLSEQWRQIARATDGTVGAAALDLGSGELVTMNADEKFPLASICKLPIAMNLLSLVDEGSLTLDQQIEVLPRDVWAGVSEIEKRWPAQRRFPLRELIEVVVAKSDNTAEETLFRVGGGALAMESRFRQWKVDGIRVDRNERMSFLERDGVEHYPPPDQWTDQSLRALTEKVPPAARYAAALRSMADPRDTGTPRGTVQLLTRLFRGEALSRPSTDFLIGVLKATTSFPTRLKGLLPTGTVVAHKTGLTGTVQGFTAGTNDSGVIYLPNSKRLAISVYVKASTRDEAARDGVIARIARTAYDAWLS